MRDNPAPRGGESRGLSDQSEFADDRDLKLLASYRLMHIRAA